MVSKLLIVDDDVRNIFSLTSVLEDHGMVVRFSENGKDALAALKKLVYDEKKVRMAPLQKVRRYAMSSHTSSSATSLKTNVFRNLQSVELPGRLARCMCAGGPLFSCRASSLPYIKCR